MRTYEMARKPTAPAGDNAELDRLAALHDRWGAHVDAMLGEGLDPVEVVEAMLTIATASMLRNQGALRTAHALLSAYGPVRAAVERPEPSGRPH